MKVFRMRRWLVAGFCFGVGYLLARLLWAVLAGFLGLLKALLFPVLVLVLMLALLAVIKPTAARQVWQVGRARLGPPLARVWTFSPRLYRMFRPAGRY